jgi:hypothetical protein
LIVCLWIALPSRLERAPRVSREIAAQARASVRASTHKALPIAMSDEDQSIPAPALGPKVMAAIGHELRGMYSGIIAEGVPEPLESGGQIDFADYPLL